MGGGVDSGDNESFDWDSEDDFDVASSSHQSATIPPQDIVSGLGQGNAAGPSCSKLVSHFAEMGFSKDLVTKAIEENGEGDVEAILEILLTYSALENSPLERASFRTYPRSSESRRDNLDTELSDLDSSPGDEEDEVTMDTLSEKEKNFLLLVEMGFDTNEASSAMDRCGPNASLVELADSIYAAQTENASDNELSLTSSDKNETVPWRFYDDSPRQKKRKWSEDEDDQSYMYNGSSRSKHRKKWSGEGSSRRNIHSQKNIFLDEDDRPLRLNVPKHMIGFGVPNEPMVRTHRKIPEAAIGPPYFYFENVALAPKGVWETISRFLYDIEPEFVDSKHFCAAARKRGYIHNLPIHGRFPLQPLPPRTIHEAFPMTRKWWPSWDPRTQLNCLQTCIASAKLAERIRQALVDSDDPPPQKIQQYVLNECRKWNLVWVGTHKVAPLEPDEIEMLLGFPRNHTRGGGISRTDRYKSLGNSFQVDTVAYHLSVLKDMFPNGINVLSLFSGIGGAEVALHRLGIPLKTVVSVEISEINRNIVRSWWEQTNQQGNLIDIADVQQLNSDRLEQMIDSFGGFDLIIGGSPCNNLTGSNRVSRDGLEGITTHMKLTFGMMLLTTRAVRDLR
ncbi:domains rearranged methyltransferase 2 isoform X2 [Tasmannia lanceolata]|uniref:domains rearranged methyltransferase 2 isoform X2 n=1 Tax=Tasmannia lanceolata TaxID=3420 RepID=UPI004062E1FC